MQLQLKRPSQSLQLLAECTSRPLDPMNNSWPVSFYNESDVCRWIAMMHTADTHWIRYNTGLWLLLFSSSSSPLPSLASPISVFSVHSVTVIAMKFKVDTRRTRKTIAKQKKRKKKRCLASGGKQQNNHCKNGPEKMENNKIRMQNLDCVSTRARASPYCNVRQRGLPLLHKHNNNAI